MSSPDAYGVELLARTKLTGKTTTKNQPDHNYY